MDCVACGEPITTKEQKKPFGLCDACLQAAEDNKPPSIADYWLQTKAMKDWMRSYALLKQVLDDTWKE